MELSRKHIVMLLIALVALWIGEVKTAHARSEKECLARIGFAEACGESVKGVVTVMNASVANARQLKISVCKVKAKQRMPDKDVSVAYGLLSNGVLSGQIKPTNNANAWRSKGHKAKGGKLVAVIGKHEFFYVKKL